MRSTITVIAAGLLALSACGSDAETTSSTSTPTTPAATTATTQPTTATAAPTTPVATTTIAGTTTTAGTTTDEVQVDFPMKMSGLVGSDIRTGTHPCFERIVIEFEGTGDLPGYWVRYEDPVIDSPRGEPVDMEGDAYLVISAASWMQTMEGEGYSGPHIVEPTNVTHIEQLQLIENFEGMFQWAVGLDETRPFTVDTLTNPARIVVDISTS
jgi:hypothetical protein